MANLSQTIIASRPGPARPRAMAWCGAGGWVMASQARQLNFSRTVCTTFPCLGTTSSVSVTSSPSLTRSPVGDHRRCGPGAQRQARDRTGSRRAGPRGGGAGTPDTLLADNGYFSQANVEVCGQAKIDPLIVPARERHHLSWRDRFAEALPAPEDPTPLEEMLHRLATPEGRALYALRKQTPEPVFAIIKSVMGFRQFSLRGLEQVKGEGNLVTMAWNIKRMFNLCPA